MRNNEKEICHDLCELCEAYKNIENEDKEAIKEKYEVHLKERVVT